MTHKKRSNSHPYANSILYHIRSYYNLSPAYINYALSFPQVPEPKTYK